MAEAKDAPAAEELADAAAKEKTAELSILKESLDKAKAEAAGNYDQLLRLKAEFENFRKRGEKEKADARRWGKEQIIVQLVSLMDVMEQAEAAAHKTTDMKSIVAGLDMIYGQFKRLLKDEGLEDVASPEGAPFDPGLHEAVETVEDEGEEGRVLSVLQKGYRFQGLLLRPARVRVSRKPAVEEKDQ
jgi:molecular chaperone GrpE